MGYDCEETRAKMTAAGEVSQAKYQWIRMASGENHQLYCIFNESLRRYVLAGFNARKTKQEVDRDIVQHLTSDYDTRKHIAFQDEARKTLPRKAIGIKHRRPHFYIVSWKKGGRQHGLVVRDVGFGGESGSGNGRRRDGAKWCK